MRFLLLSPKTSSLGYREDELEGVLRSGLDITPRLGPVGYRDFVREVTSGEYDGLWVIGHGNEVGIELTDGVLAYNLMLPLVANRFGLIVLNTCHSFAAAQAFQKNANTDLVTTVGEVNDQEAFQFGLLFAQALSKHGDSRLAFIDSSPVDGRQLYISALGKTGTMNEIAELSRVMGELTKAVYKLDARMETIERAVAMTSDHEKRIIILEARPQTNVYAITGLASIVGVVISELFHLVLR